MINILKNQGKNRMELEQRFNCPRLEFNQEQIKSQNQKKKEQKIMLL